VCVQIEGKYVRNVGHGRNRARAGAGGAGGAGGVRGGAGGGGVRVGSAGERVGVVFEVNYVVNHHVQMELISTFRLMILLILCNSQLSFKRLYLTWHM